MAGSVTQSALVRIVRSLTGVTIGIVAAMASWSPSLAVADATVRFSVVARSPCVAGRCTAYATYLEDTPRPVLVEVDWDHSGPPAQRFSPMTVERCGADSPDVEYPQPCVVRSPVLARAGTHAIVMRLTSEDGDVRFGSQSLRVTSSVRSGAHHTFAQPTRKASHKGWPTIDGMLLINKFDQSRPLDARGNHDPFDGTDPRYRCDGDHDNQGCFLVVGACLAGPRTNMCAGKPVNPRHSKRHNELLGAHGNDTIHAGDAGDVLWADYKASGQPVRQRDELHGGKGKDFIYSSHGRNIIHTGGGADVVHAHYGHGAIYCDSATTIVYLSHRSRPRYSLHHCSRISYKPAGTQQA